MKRQVIQVRNNLKIKTQEISNLKLSIKLTVKKMISKKLFQALFTTSIGKVLF